MAAVGILHDQLVINRRVEILSGWFAQLAPSRVRILDVGCGDGLLSAAIRRKRPDLDIRGIDVLVREHTHIRVEQFDGSKIPFDDGAFDAVLFSDVLHHTDDPKALMREARRVTNQFILIKDHNRNGIAAGARLRFMDWVGNARFGVALPYNYWTKDQWYAAWQAIGLRPERVVQQLSLYPGPANWIFGAGLHFIARLERCT